MRTILTIFLALCLTLLTALLASKYSRVSWADHDELFEMPEAGGDRY